MLKLKTNSLEEITKNVFVQNYYIYNDVKYIVDNKNVIIDYSNNFILDISNCNISDEVILKQVK